MAAWFENFQRHFHQNFIHHDRWTWLLDGLQITMQVAIIAITTGIFLGIILASMRMVRINLFKKLGLDFIDNVINWITGGISYIYIDIIRGTPVVTQLLIWHFIVFAGTGMPVMIVAAIALGVNSGAFVSENIRTGILSIDKGQTEAGRSLGLPPAMTMRYIVMPQAIKNILPTLVNEFIVLIRETAIVGFVGLADLTQAGNRIFGVTFNAWFPLIGAAMIYYTMIKILTIFLRKLERRLRKADLR